MESSKQGVKGRGEGESVLLLTLGYSTVLERVERGEENLEV